MIQLNAVSKEYPKRGHALQDVSISVHKGEFAFLTGHSGSGKTTTLKLIHMAERPTAGEVLVCGYASGKTRDREVWEGAAQGRLRPSRNFACCQVARHWRTWPSHSR